MSEIVWKYDEPLTDENLITEFETKSGFTFPPSYRSLVIEHNGARPDKKIFNTDSDEGHVFGNLLSFNKADTKNLNIWETNKNMPTDIDSKYIAFAMDAFGNWICFNAEDGSIVFIDHDNSSIENISNDFDGFLNSLYSDETESSPSKDDEPSQTEEDEESIDNTAQSDEGTVNAPTEDETVAESVTPVKKSIYEDTGIELEEDDLITESFAIENFSKFRDKLYNSEAPKCSVTLVNNNSFNIKINNGTAKEYIVVTNEFHGKVSAIAHTLSGDKKVVSSDLMSVAYTKIRKAIIGLFGNFKVVSESYSPIEFGDSSFSRWGTNLIQESVDNKKAKPIYFVFVSEHKPLLSNIIRNVTKSDWTHAGIAFEPALTKIYTYAIKKGENKKDGDSGVGFIAESINDYANRKSDDVVSVVCGFVPSKKLKQMKDAVKKYEIMSENTTFSWKIIFDFLVGKGKVNTSTEETSYNQVCSSFVQKILSTADIKVNEDGSLVSPESLHEGLFSKKNSVEECWKGIAKDFNEKELKDNISKFADKKRTKVIEEEDTSLSEEVEDDEDINFDDTDEEEEVSFDDIELDDDDDEIFTSGDFDEYKKDDLSDNMSFDEPSSYIEPESIGSDNTSVQNEYDPKELETLNKLIASELNASNEYWDANKETKKPVLSKLYADIGDEERFHTEQLLYAKSQLTGEAYEPHDPEVKKEYEELKALGMDSETAMYTAIDKTTLRSFSDNETEEDAFEEVQESFLAVEYACTTYELYSMIMESNSKVNISRCTSIIMESMIFEAVDTNDKNKHIKLPMNTNPLVAAGKLFVRLLKLIKNLRIKLRRFREKSYKSAQLKHAWIKRHGIKGLFKDGIYLYFYDETRPKLSMINVLYQLIDRVDAALAVICKDFRLGTYNRYPLSYQQTGGKRIQFTTTKQAVNALLNIHLTRTKLIVTEENEEALEKKFFGETPGKFKDMNDKNRSVNEYNIFDLGLQTAEDFMEKNVNEVMGRLEQMIQNADSIYYKKEQEYNKLDEAMKVVAKTTENIIKAVTNDLAEYTKVDNNCLKAATEEKDNPSPKNPSDPDNNESTEDLNKEHTDHGKDSEHRNTNDGRVIDVDFTEL